LLRGHGRFRARHADDAVHRQPAAARRRPGKAMIEAIPRLLLRDFTLDLSQTLPARACC
jgi:hypothetical protein